MLTVSSRSAFLAGLAGARETALGAYALSPGSLISALEAAAARGARVSVRLAADPHAAPGLSVRNAALVDDLRLHGVDAELAQGPNLLHLKAAVADGVTFLDDRDWPEGGGDTILRSSSPEVAALVRDAIAGTPGRSDSLATGKREALALEEATIAGAPPGSAIDCESETFGFCAVEARLAERARAGDRVRLLVNGRTLGGPGSPELRAIQRLEAAGVEVRAGPAAEKLCLTEAAAWVGSANATCGAASAIDWGLVSAEAALRATVGERFAVNWSHATPV
jgi:hypothetical protein